MFLVSSDMARNIARWNCMFPLVSVPVVKLSVDLFSV